MSTTLFIILMIAYACSGGTMLGLHFIYRSQFGKRHMISDDPHRSVDDKRLYRDAALNIGVSVTLIFSMVFGLKDYLFYQGSTPVWIMLVEAIAVILIYDFAYYFFHRYPLHEWNLLRSVHAAVYVKCQDLIRLQRKTNSRYIPGVRCQTSKRSLHFSFSKGLYTFFSF